MKRTAVLVLIALISLITPLAGFAAEPAAEPGAAIEPPAADARPEQGPQALTMGMILYTDAPTQEKTIAPLVAYLERRLGREIRLRFFHDYFSILNGLDHESIDISLLSPAIYALIMDDPALTIMAVPLERDKLFYHSIILTHKDGPIDEISDLEGKRIGFVDKYSASGYLVPAAYLAEQGLLGSGSRRYTPVFLGTHGKAVRALLEKKVDAVCTYDTFFDFTGHQLGEYRNLNIDTFRLLKLLPERVPSDALVCRTALGNELTGKLQKAMVDYRKERNEKDSPLQQVIYSGFQTKPGDGYRELRKRLETVMGSDREKENVR